MRSSVLRRAAAGLALLALTSGLAAAHQFWLDVSDHTPRPGEPVAVGALSGTGFRGEAQPLTFARLAPDTTRRAAP